MRSLAALVFSVLALLAVPATGSAALGELQLISRADGVAGAIGDNNSHINERSISADGRFVVFISYSDNFGGPYTAERNVYRRDLALGRTEVVSRANGVAGAIGDDTSFGAAISADGNRIAFASGADNLSTVDNNTYSNIFLRDMSAGTTILISRADGAGVAGNNSSIVPTISGDGNVVAYQSQASNLDGTVTDNNAQVDTFVRDTGAATTRLVSKTTAGVIGNGLSGAPDLSYDGRYVVYTSSAANLGGTLTAGTANVYLRDRTLNTTTLISQPSGTTNVGGNDSSGSATVTSDGKQIAFFTRSTNFAGDAPGGAIDEGYIRDLNANTTTLITRAATGAPANGAASSGTISPDGSAVVFLSRAPNLENSTDLYDQVYVRELASGKTTLVTRGVSGAPGNYNDAQDTSFGQSNSMVVFTSESDNLFPGFTSHLRQVFLRNARVPDPDPPAATAATVSGKKFVAKLSKRKFKIKATTGGGATTIAARVTIKVPKGVARSRKVVIKLKALTVPATRTSHTLSFKLSKKQNKLVLKALKSKRTRLSVAVALTASAPGGTGTATVSGKLRR